MKYLISIILLVLVGCSGNQCKVEAGKEAKADYFNSVVTVAAVDKLGQPLLFGSAFAIDKDRLVTAAHVCLGILEIQIFNTGRPSIVLQKYDSKGALLSLYGSSVDEIHTTQDLCILKRTAHKLPPVSFGDYSKVAARDLVTIIGSPAGIGIATFDGKVINPKHPSPSPWYKDRLIVSAAATGGVSGSPVFDSKGLVIGVLVAGHMTFDHMSICIRGDILTDWLDSLK